MKFPKLYSRKFTHWLRLGVIYCVLTLTIIIVSSLFIHFNSLIVVGIAIIGIWSVSYFAPQLTQLVFRARQYRGKYRKRIREQISHQGVFIKELFIINKTQANAYAISFLSKKSIVYHSHLLEECTWAEIEAVTAHELGHHAHHDITLYAALASFLLLVSVLVNAEFYTAFKGNLVILFFIWLLVSLFVLLTYLSISRLREAYADQYAKQYSKHPTGLATFLKRFISEAKADGIKIPRRRSHFQTLFYMHPWIYDRIDYFNSTKK